MLWLEDGQFKDLVTMATDPVCGMAVEREQAVTLALSEREDAFTALKTMLDKPGAANEAAYRTAKQLADRSALPAVAAMLELCATMNATPDECNAAAGLPG